MMKSTWRLEPAKNLVNYQKEWDELATNQHNSLPTLMFDFIWPMVEHFAEKDTMLAIEEQNHQPTSLMLINRSAGKQCWSFNPSQSTNLLAVFSHKTLDANWFHQLSKLGYFWQPVFSLLKFDCQFFPGIESNPRIRSAHYSTTIAIECQGTTFDDYWQKRSRKLRNNIRRYFKRLDEQSISYHLKVNQTPEEITTALTRYGEMESRGWKGQIDTAISIENSQGKFYLDVLSRFAKHENYSATIYELYFGDKLSASRIIIDTGKIGVSLKTTYDESFSEYSPGRLLYYLTLQEIFNHAQLKQIEFYTKANSDQLQWATQERAIEHVNFYRYPFFNLLLSK